MGLKKQVISQKVLIDPDSGEQIGRAQTRKVVRPEYVSFSKDFCKLHHVTDQFTDSQIGKLVRLSNYLDYYTNMLVDKGDGRKPIPLDYAGIGYTYDSSRDAFISPQPYPSWTLNEATCGWDAPVAIVDDGKQYQWDESITNWKEIE